MWGSFENYVTTFRKTKTVEERRVENNKFRAKYPNRVAVVVSRVNSQTPKLTKNKFLVPSDLLALQFVSLVRNRMAHALNGEQAIYLFTEDNVLVTGSKLISQVYAEHKNLEDGFLYMGVSTENTFGDVVG